MFRIIYCIVMYSAKWTEARTDNKDTKHRYKEALSRTHENMTLNAFLMQFCSAGGLHNASWIGYNCIKIPV